MPGDVIAVLNLHYHLCGSGPTGDQSSRKSLVGSILARRARNRRYSADRAVNASSAPRPNCAATIRDHCAATPRAAASASHILARGCKCNAF